MKIFGVKITKGDILLFVGLIVSVVTTVTLLLGYHS